MGALAFGHEEGGGIGATGGETAADEVGGLDEEAFGAGDEGELFAGAEELEEGVTGGGDEEKGARADRGGGDADCDLARGRWWGRYVSGCCRSGTRL